MAATEEPQRRTLSHRPEPRNRRDKRPIEQGWKSGQDVYSRDHKQSERREGEKKRFPAIVKRCPDFNFFRPSCKGMSDDVPAGQPGKPNDCGCRLHRHVVISKVLPAGSSDRTFTMSVFHTRRNIDGSCSLVENRWQ